MAEGDTLVNSLIGGAFTIVTGSIVPVAPLFGGAIAAYLQGGDRSEGVKVGIYAGLISLVPVVFLAFFVSSIFGLVGLFGGDFLAGFAGAVFFVMVFFFSVLYFVGLSAVGGWLGNYVKYETDVDL